MEATSFHVGAVTGLGELTAEKKNIGPWLALREVDGKYEVLARGKNAKTVYRLARKKGVIVPVITKVPSPSVGLFLWVFGLLCG